MNTYDLLNVCFTFVMLALLSDINNTCYVSIYLINSDSYTNDSNFFFHFSVVVAHEHCNTKIAELTDSAWIGYHFLHIFTAKQRSCVLVLRAGRASAITDNRIV